MSNPSYQPKTLAIGTNTDPYQPIEGQHKIMRGCLEVLRDFMHPVGIVTKGTLVERDIDILREMAHDGLARVGISITSLDPDLSRRFEPRVPSPARRFKTIERLSEAGIPVTIFVAPVVPGLTDSDLEGILQQAKDAGANSATWSLLRLPFEVSGLFQDWLAQHYPSKVEKVMGKVRENHGGKDYDPQWGKRMRGEGVYARFISQRFKVACKRLDLDPTRVDLRADLFRVPPRVGDQLTLF